MKKLTAIILSVLLLFSCMSVTASAAEGGGIIGELATDFFERIIGAEVEEDTPLTYGVFYEMEPMGGVSVIYKPNPSISFSNPGTYIITSDTPLSVDHEFICWETADGTRYDAGDQLYVDGQITLYAVWVEKTDDDVRVVRVIKTTIEALRRLFGKFFGFFDTFVEYYENFVPTKADDPRYYDLTCNQVFYEKDTTGKVFLYLNSFEMYHTLNLSRIEDNGNLDCSIYFCTDWHKATEEPLNYWVVDPDPGFYFAKLQGANESDIITIDDVDEYDAQYIESLDDGILNDGDTYYMVITIDDALYSSPATESKLYPEFTNPVSYVFTLTK